VGVVLLVETELAQRESLLEEVRASGHEPLVATSLADALVRIREGGLDAVVFDCADPRSGLVELAHEINALTDAPPLVLVSGSVHAPEISVRIGAAAFVPKPVEASELVAVLARVAGTVRPVQEFDDEEPTSEARSFGAS